MKKVGVTQKPRGLYCPSLTSLPTRSLLLLLQVDSCQRHNLSINLRSHGEALVQDVAQQGRQECSAQDPQPLRVQVGLQRLKLSLASSQLHPPSQKLGLLSPSSEI
eukprot:CAMPEP_0115068546 /NCGR_PEP_ID=MMETSP0227-20121206/12031_2 /TAXON_ID=89957 /ORGANISM="Polarella glacialis, Strain CCMP 1383" /LENGTH=105 /DNA_ID=CAMNT_0002454787 /DNA_START=106 /DNA_END=423 /DNA_ORIENTATION=-